LRDHHRRGHRPMERPRHRPSSPADRSGAATNAMIDAPPISQAAVRFERVSKRFPGVQALTDVTLDIVAGSVHALCGENGAGKSTLGKMLAGIYPLDEGRLFVNAIEARFGSPRDALRAGV